MCIFFFGFFGKYAKRTMTRVKWARMPQKPYKRFTAKVYFF